MKKIFILLSFAFIGLSLTAQDVHFSQYYASPLTLNPALTGKFNGMWRATAIYRDQWRNIQQQKENTFQTPSVSVDFSLLKDALLKNSSLGIGGVVTYDKVGSINTLDAGLSLAYHLGLDQANKYHIAVGFQGMYTNRKIGADYLFEEEITDNTHIDDNKLDTEAHHLWSLTPGVLFDAKVAKIATLYAGYSMFMNLTPEEDIYVVGSSYKDNGLPIRHVAHLGAEIDIKKWIVIPGALYQMTDNTDEINFGVTVGYKLIEAAKKNTKLFLGVWYRMNEGGALIPKVGVDFENFRISGAYDLVLFNDLSRDSQSAIDKIPTAFEISINYFGQGSTPKPTNTYLFNPRF